MIGNKIHADYANCKHIYEGQFIYKFVQLTLCIYMFMISLKTVLCVS